MNRNRLIDITENSQSTPIIMVGICCTLVVTEMRTHKLARKKDVGKKVITKSPKDILAFKNITLTIPPRAKMLTKPKSNKNLRTIQRKRDSPLFWGYSISCFYVVTIDISF